MHLMSMGKVYSYTRFSTPEQAAGDSYRRQTEAARKWAEARGLVLDDRLSFADEGVSAYRGSNIDGGTGLGAFLEACRKGLVEPDSYLLVESLDRLSRLPARRAQRLLSDIVDSGVTVVTLSDGQEYTAEKLDNDPTSLIISLLVSIRAHEESKTKGRRVSAAWAEKRERVRSGADEKLTSRAPGWLEWSEEGWQFAEPHAATVRRVYQMTIDGIGEHVIAKALNEEGVPVMGRGKAWHRSTIAKLLRNPAVTGRLTPGRIDYDEHGKRRRVLEEPIEGAFPRVISEEDWLAVRAIKDGTSPSSRGRPAKAGIQNLFAGLAKCPDCGATMTRVFKGKRGGTPKLVCTMAKLGKADHSYASVNQNEVEDAFARNWQGLLADVPAGEPDEHLNHLVEDLEGSLRAKEDHLGEVSRELELRPSTAGLRQARRIEEELRTLRAQLQEAEERREMADRGMIATRLATLADVIEDEDNPMDTARVNAALKVLFKGIVIDHHHGFLAFQWRQGGATELFYRWVEA